MSPFSFSVPVRKLWVQFFTLLSLLFLFSVVKTVGTIFYFTVISHLNDLPSLLRYLAKETPEKFWPKLDSNPDLCDAGAVLPQLSYGANWEQVVICVKDKAVVSGCMRFS